MADLLDHMNNSAPSADGALNGHELNYTPITTPVESLARRVVLPVDVRARLAGTTTATLWPVGSSSSVSSRSDDGSATRRVSGRSPRSSSSHAPVLDAPRLAERDLACREAERGPVAHRERWLEAATQRRLATGDLTEPRPANSTPAPAAQPPDFESDDVGPVDWEANRRAVAAMRERHR